MKNKKSGFEIIFKVKEWFLENFDFNKRFKSGNEVQNQKMYSSLNDKVFHKIDFTVNGLYRDHPPS